MNFVGKHLNAIGLVLLLSFASAAAAIYWDVPRKIKESRSAAKPKTSEACVVHMGKSAETTAMEGGCTRSLAEGAGADGCCGKETATVAPAIESSCCAK